MNLNEELPLINMKRMKTSPSRQFHRFSEFFALMRNGFTKRWDGRERGIYSFMGHRSGFLCKARWRKRHKTNGMMVASRRESESNGLHSSSAFYEALRCWSFTIINCFHLVFMPDTFWAIHKIAICSAQHLKFPHVSYASSQHDSHIQRSSLRSSLVETKLAENFPPSDVVGKQKNCSGKKSYKNKLNNFRLLWGGSRDDKHFLYYPECSYAIV